MLFAVLAAAALASLFITPLVVRAASRWELYDIPADARRVHTSPIPRLGGVAVFVAMAAGLLLARLGGGWLDLSAAQGRFFVGILLGGCVVFAAGLWDDVRGLSPLAKLAAQCAAAALVFSFGFRIEVLSIGLGSEAQLGAWALPLTVFWIVGVTNAFNLIDGLDGLATGIAIVALATTLAVALALGNLEVAIVCVALLGALIGFLRYNFNPARIFLGDSGSLFVGFMLAVLSVHGSLKSTTAVLAIVPLLALAIPLLDTLLAIVRRWLRGTPLSGADARHIHHRLVAIGLTHRHAVIVLYLVAMALAMLGVVLAFAPAATAMRIGAAGSVASLLLLLYGMHRLKYHEFIEAGAVLASGAFRVRRVIQDQIHARDLTHVIDAAATLEEIDAILEDNAAAFGFLGMAVCRETSSSRAQMARWNGAAARASKLDYPVMPRASVFDDPYVLRIWSGTATAYRPYGRERVARLLAPVIERRLAELGALERRTPAEPAVAATAAARDVHPSLASDSVLGWLNGSRAAHAHAHVRPSAGRGA
jgi:UDP-GlcNAc:undecaprenyl-phosphate GlcNAc-1-phosphate transferase